MAKVTAKFSLDTLKQQTKQLEEQEKEIRQLKRTIELSAKRQRKYVVEVPTTANTLKWGAFSDPHFGSLYTRKDALVQFLARCQAEKVHDLLLSGDIFAGHRMYKGQEFEIHAQGFDQQFDVLKAAVNEGLFDGFNVHYITGNHDASFKKASGTSVGIKLEKEFKNWQFMGEDYAAFELRNKNGVAVNVALMHPGKGTAYALSYQAQKHVEALSGGEKPDFMFIGHYHKSEWIPGYRNVQVFQVGCFESQTPFMKTRSIVAMMGGWIVEHTPGDRKNLTTRTKAEFVAFFEPQN